MKKRKITLELSVFATELETQLIRDAALNAAWEKTYSYRGCSIAAFTRIENLDNGNVEHKEESRMPTVEDALRDPEAFELGLNYLGWTLTPASGGSALLILESEAKEIMNHMNAQRAARLSNHD